MAYEWCLYITQAPCLSSDEWAAWIQAIGSLAGIAIAIAIPWHQRKQQTQDEQKREQARQRAIGAWLYGGLLDLRNELMRKKQFWKDGDLQELRDDAPLFFKTDLKIPDSILDAAIKPDIFQHTPSSLQQLFFEITRFSYNTGNLLERWIERDHDPNPARNRFAANLDRLLVLTEEAINQLSTTFGHNNITSQDGFLKIGTNE